MSAWQEYRRWAETGESIVQLLGPTQIEKNRYYVKIIGEPIQFLAVNEEARHGHNHEGGEEGLFLKFFDYTIKKDAKLAEIVKYIPENAKYTSNVIENEINEALAKMVVKDIRTKYEKADSLCIKSDGTRDQYNIGNVSVVIRFVQISIPEEHLIGLIELNQLDAEYICNQIQSHLSELGYSPDNLVCQYNLLGISWVDSGLVPLLNPGNVLDYFSERSNPFYDRTCNNEVVKMQRLTLDHLNQMVGVEYILLHAQEPILYIIRKQQRQSPTQVAPLADYYIILGVVYQAPDLGSVIGSRVPKPGEKPVPVEVKKEPEPPADTVKQEERDPAKTTPQAPATKGPPEKRARLQ
ncbi:MED6 polymerase, partial [Polypterus senegalus]